MTRHRLVATLLACAVLTGTAAAEPTAARLKRLGKTVVQQQDETVKAVLSWRYANQTFEKEPWLLLELALAAEGKPVNLHREDVALIAPGGERIPLPSQKRLAEGFKDVRWALQKASVARDPVADYFSRPTLLEPLRFFAVPSEGIVRDEVAGGPTYLIQGDLFFEAPAGVWKPGAYTLVIRNKTMAVELPFHLPADEVRKEKKGPDGKTVPW